jgi:hypothetical protein
MVLHLQFELVQPSTDDSNESKRLAPFLQSVQISEVVPLHLTRNPASGQDFQLRLSTEIWTGLRLGHGERSGARYVLVVGKIKPKDECYERIGVIKIPHQWLDNQELYKAQFWLG